MPESVSDRVTRWLQGEESSDLLEIHTRVEYLAERQFHEYEPTRGPYPDFLTRCRDWLDNVDDEEDQRLLLELVPSLLFISRSEFEALYRSALNECVIPWLVRLLGLHLDDPTVAGALSDAIAKTWFCGGTDSMQISSFYHVNRVTGASIRPDFRSLRALKTPPETIKALMERNTLTHIVILEDFVGSGTQIAGAVTLAASLPNKPPILVCPLICCPPGRKKLGSLTEKWPWVTVAPVFEPPVRAFVSKEQQSDEPELHTRVRSLVNRSSAVVCEGDSACDPFGFREIGALVVLHTNCPNNTLALVHRTAPSWSPLFPRSIR